VNTGGRGLLQVQWWPAGPKLVLDQMTAWVLEITDSSSYAIQDWIQKLSEYYPNYITDKCMTLK
jgi:hypothetical protein